jgi:ABC-type multidrug transport system ATPase subunit
MTKEIAIAAKNITKNYGEKSALNGLNLSVNRGEI